jgi:Ser/Thr protein kinase RdoA (MazF antagonist)
MTLVGKIRAARYGKAGHRLLTSLWSAGFDADAPDGIAVPEPIGTIGTFRMWLQRKVPGVRATEALTGVAGVACARRIAEAAAKIHRAGVPAAARHTMADELRILRDCFARLTQDRPHYSSRLAALLAACERVAAETPRCAATGIHRDFYADQVLVDGARLYIVDFDLYCEGEPALDIGNFVGHLTELSVRVFGRPDALADREAALEDRFVELAGESTRAAVRTYATLTLARHVYLSTTFPERRPFTDALLELCEQRLGAGRALAGSH